MTAVALPGLAGVRRAAVPQEGVRAYLARVQAAAESAGRADLVERLQAERARLDGEEFMVVVAGEFGRGRSAVVNAVLGLPVCGVSATRATTVPTFVRYGRKAAARVVEAPAEAGAAPVRRPVPLGEVNRLTLREPSPSTPAPLAVEVQVPREILRDGLVLVDTPGVGGGLAAPGAGIAVRVIGSADAVVFVTDASAELAAPEVDLLREVLEVCPTALLVVTKIDLHPDWRRVVELDRAHLAAAGLDLPALPVSTVLRELAVDTGDRALAAESGFPALTAALGEHLRRRRRADLCHRAVVSASAVAEQLQLQAGAEAASLADPSRREDLRRQAVAAEQRLARLQGAASRWQENLADEVRAWRRLLPRDLTDRLRDLRERARARLQDIDPDHGWDDFEPWFHREVNQRLAAHHRAALERLRSGADAVAAQFDVEAGELPLDLARGLIPGPGPGPDASPHVARPQAGHTSMVDVGVTAARGFSLSSALVNVVVVLAGASLTTVGLPLTAALGAVFAVRSVRGLRDAQRGSLRQQAEQAVALCLQDVQAATTRMDEELVDSAYIQVRDHLAALGDELRRTARAVVEATARAAEDAGPDSARRVARAQATRHEVEALRRCGQESLRQGVIGA